MNKEEDSETMNANEENHFNRCTNFSARALDTDEDVHGYENS